MPERSTCSRNEEDESPEKFYFLFAALQALGFTSIILVFIWADKYLGGFAWDGSGKMFNWHPVLMVIGLVYLYGNAVVVYRVMKGQPRITIKLIHAGLHICALIVALIGLGAVFEFHEHQAIPNLYSIHSWVGMTTVVLFSCQLIFGFTAFLYPKFSEEGRRRYLDVHVYFGGIIFVFSIISCISGITEKMLFSFKDTYSQLPSGALIGNGLAVFLLAFGMLVGYMLNKVS